MKNKWLIASVLIVVLIGLCGVSMFAVWQGAKLVGEGGARFRGFRTNAVSAQATEEKSLAVKGPVSLNVENTFGDVSVKAGADGQVNVKAEKKGWGNNEADAQAAVKELKVVIKQEGDTINISVQQPAEINMLHIGSDAIGSVKFTITVPKQTAATLHSSNGDVALDGTTGSADVQSNFGDVTITNVTGEAFGKSNNGKVTARKLTADEKITLSSDFGAITLSDATGSDVSVSSSSGQLELKNVRAAGLLKAGNQFGNVHVADSQAGTAEIESNNGALRLENLDVDGKITVKSDFGSLTLTKVDAESYDLETQNGKISVDGAKNEIKAHSDFGSVEVVNAQNATLDLSSTNGAITFSGSLGGGPHSLKSDFGNLHITLPAETALDVELETEFGKITSDFSITVNGIIDSKHWKGAVNGGGASLTAKTNNGNVTLHVSK